MKMVEPISSNPCGKCHLVCHQSCNVGPSSFRLLSCRILFSSLNGLPAKGCDCRSQTPAAFYEPQSHQIHRWNTSLRLGYRYSESSWTYTLGRNLNIQTLDLA